MARSFSRQTLAWAGVLILLLLTAWFGWRALRDARPEGGAANVSVPRPSTVIVQPAVEREVVETLVATGTLRAVRRAEVAAREVGAVEALGADEGDLVQADAVIAWLDPRRLEAQWQEASAALTAAQAELTQREAEHERTILDEEMMRGLWNEKAVAEREYLDSVRELKVAEARENAAREGIEAAQKRLDLLEVRRTDLEVRAPFAGRVVQRHTEIGEWLKEGDPVVTLVSTGEIEAWLQLPERHVEALKQTAPESVDLRLPGRAEALHADKLTLVPDVDGRSRRFILIAHIPDPENALTPGSSVEASVPLGRPEKRLVVPSDAVLKSYSGDHVFVPEENGQGPPLAKRVLVEVLFERSGVAVLAAGSLRSGDLVIVEGNERLFPDTPLDPRSPDDVRILGSPGKLETVQTR
ncbi:MAG TPA: efflux RND transporter periplasmic adaptor subunit [Verrucomicrobiales bacterium]|nr:efflux RND transporter periplasmic adaptor subunit [Verrucomicrobiales bacterium]